MPAVSPAVRRSAPRALWRPAAQGAASGTVIPYDYAASFRLRGIPGNVVPGVINISVDGTFVATAIGYGFEEARARRLELPRIDPPGPATSRRKTFTLGDITLGSVSPDALINGFRLKPAPFAAEDASADDRSALERIFAQESRHDVLERLNPPSDLSFFFSMVDSNSGRELQDEPVHNLASLGKSNGERPFRQLPQPLSFAPRSTVRLQVIENSEGVEGTLFIVMFGYQILAASHCPEPLVRALRGTPRCPGEIIGVPTAEVSPFDYVANVELLGRPQRLVQHDVNVNVEGGFVATAIGYALGVDSQDVRLREAVDRLQPGTAEIELGELPLSAFPPEAVLDGFRIRSSFLRIAFENGGRLTSRLPRDLIDKIFVSLNRPEDVSFRYSIFDAGTGRELQNGLINNVAGLGIANGDRPFKIFSRPMIFSPRSAIRVLIKEHFGRGRLFMVFQGYKLPPGGPQRGRRR